MCRVLPVRRLAVHPAAAQAAHVRGKRGAGASGFGRLVSRVRALALTAVGHYGSAGTGRVRCRCSSASAGAVANAGSQALPAGGGRRGQAQEAETRHRLRDAAPSRRALWLPGTSLRRIESRKSCKFSLRDWKPQMSAGGDLLLPARAQARGGAGGRAQRLRLYSSARGGGRRSYARGALPPRRWLQLERCLDAGHSVGLASTLFVSIGDTVFYSNHFYESKTDRLLLGCILTLSCGAGPSMTRCATNDSTSRVCF